MIINYESALNRFMKASDIIDIDDTLRDIKTGDIFFTRLDYKAQPNPLLYFILNVGHYNIGNGLYTHTGVFIKIDNEVYILQDTASPLFDYLTNTYAVCQICLVKARDYFNLYKGNVYIYKSRKEVTIPNSILVNKMRHITQVYRPSRSIITWADSILGINSSIQSNQVLCTNVSILMLQILGLVNTEINPLKHYTMPDYTKIINSLGYQYTGLMNNIHTIHFSKANKHVHFGASY